jgi:translation initiation factor IF-1
MVKNTKGGSGHKSQARKFVAPKSSNKTRLSDDESELYAFVVNKSGGDNMIVMCQDEKERRCVIRGKFRSSRGKRDNFISKGSWVLVGVRDWSSDNQVCDLLEVYNENDKIKLKLVNGINWNKFVSHDLECSNIASTNEDDSFQFSNNTAEEDEYKQLVSDTNQKQIMLHSINEEDEEQGEDINIDDI